MARVYPQTINKDTKSDAERKIFQIFQTCLSNKFTVFHSVSWIGRLPSGMACDGESDFIVSHPELGVLTIEVKGGRISIDGKSGKWLSKDRYGIDHELNRSPFIQATESHHNLFRKLQESPITNKFHYPVYHAVCFPDGIVGQDFGLGAPKEIIIDWQRLKNPEKTIYEIFTYWGQQSNFMSPGESGIDALIELLAPNVTLKSFLSLEFESEEQQLKKLTQQQFKILDGMSRNRRMLIMGCAGSGKTMLALEKARRLANDGYAVLFTCFNSRLADWILSTEYNRPGITISNFHQLCIDWAQKAGIKFPTLNSEEVGGDEEYYFNELIPQIFLEAINIRKPNYNAIIVDEGQDFRENWWVPLEALLVNPNQNVFYIFADDNQNIFAGAEKSYPFQEPVFFLTENCRNTQKIHKIVRKYYQGNIPIECNGPEGREPEIKISNQPTGVIEVLRQTLHQLTHNEKIYTKDIIILTPRSKKSSLLKDGIRLGNLTISWEKNFGNDNIQCSTIHSFKGLERPVVVLAEIDDLPNKEREKLVYIATSRAKNHLVILGNLP